MRHHPNMIEVGMRERHISYPVRCYSYLCELFFNQGCGAACAAFDQHSIVAKRKIDREKWGSEYIEVIGFLCRRYFVCCHIKISKRYVVPATLGFTDSNAPGGVL